MNYFDIEKDIVLLEAKQKILGIEHQERISKIENTFVTESYSDTTIDFLLEKEENMYLEATLKDTITKMKAITKKTVAVNKRVIENYKKSKVFKSNGDKITIKLDTKKAAQALSDLSKYIAELNTQYSHVWKEFIVAGNKLNIPSLSNSNIVIKSISKETTIDRMELYKAADSISASFKDIDRAIQAIPSEFTIDRGVSDYDNPMISKVNFLQKLLSLATQINNNVMTKVSYVKEERK